VKCPNPGFNTVYDEWLQSTPENYNGTTKPRYRLSALAHTRFAYSSASVGVEKYYFI